LFYKIDIEIDIISEELEAEMIHVVYQLKFKNAQYLKIDASVTSSSTTKSAKCRDICKPIKAEIFFELFPFHIIFNRNLVIVSIGESLKQALKSAKGESIKDVLNLVRPYIPFTWDDVSFSLVLPST
jgi:guanylate cyclase